MTWIFFNEPVVWSFLRIKGHVYTVRSLTRPTGIAYTIPGRKQVHVELCEPYCSIRLGRYVAESGFPSIADWMRVIERQHGVQKPHKLGIFHVELVELANK